MTAFTDLVKRAEQARNWPVNTCGASREALTIAEQLHKLGYASMEQMRDGRYDAESIAATVAALWEARTRIAQLEAGSAT